MRQSFYGCGHTYVDKHNLFIWKLKIIHSVFWIYKNLFYQNKCEWAPRFDRPTPKHVFNGIFIIKQTWFKRYGKEIRILYTYIQRRSRIHTLYQKILPTFWLIKIICVWKNRFCNFERCILKNVLILKWRLCSNHQHQSKLLRKRPKTV